MTMEYEEVVKILTLKFTSGNDIPVTRSTILLEEWEVLKAEIERLKEIEFMYMELEK